MKALGIVLVGVALATSACFPSTGGKSQGLAPNTRVQQTMESVDPLSTDGTWLVPEEIKPGTYRTSLTESLGYAELCADATCKIGTSGFIENYVFDGPGVLVIPSNAVTVKLNGIALTPMASR